MNHTVVPRLTIQLNKQANECDQTPDNVYRNVDDGPDGESGEDCYCCLGVVG
jgi:hypothetical protein